MAARFGRTPEDDVNAYQHALTAYAMRLRGYSFRAIAEKCGYVGEDGKPYPNGAKKAFLRGLKDANADRIKDVEMARAEAHERYMAYLTDLYEAKGRESTARLVEVAVKVEERYAKLFGLDVQPDVTLGAPPQLIISEALSQALQGATVVQALGAPHGDSGA